MDYILCIPIATKLYTKTIFVETGVEKSKREAVFLIACPVVVCRVAGDIIFAVDASGSVGKNNFQKLMDAVLRTVLMLDLTASVGNAGARVIFFTFTLSTRIFWKVYTCVFKYEADQRNCQERPVAFRVT